MCQEEVQDTGTGQIYFPESVELLHLVPMCLFDSEVMLTTNFWQ